MAMAGIKDAVGALTIVGIGVFILVLLLALNYGAYRNSSQNLYTSLPSVSTGTNTINAIDIVSVNAITILPTGSNTGISATNPLTVSITGTAVSAYATNLIFSAPGSVQTQTFILPSNAANTVCTACGNFYNITSITVSSPTLVSLTGLQVKVTQPYDGVPHLVNPWSSNTVNSLTMTSSINFPVLANYTTYGGGVANTFGSNLQLAVFAVVFAAIILAVVSALRGAGLGESGSFL